MRVSYYLFISIICLLACQNQFKGEESTTQTSSNEETTQQEPTTPESTGV